MKTKRTRVTCPYCGSPNCNLGFNDFTKRKLKPKQGFSNKWVSELQSEQNLQKAKELNRQVSQNPPSITNVEH